MRWLDLQILPDLGQSNLDWDPTNSNRMVFVINRRAHGGIKVADYGRVIWFRSLHEMSPSSLVDGVWDGRCAKIDQVYSALEVNFTVFKDRSAFRITWMSNMLEELLKIVTHLIEFLPIISLKVSRSDHIFLRKK